MKKKKIPFYRKNIAPWDISDKLSYILLIPMTTIIFFSLAGIDLCMEQPKYKGYIGVPSALMVLSSLIALISVFRILNHIKKKYFTK